MSDHVTLLTWIGGTLLWWIVGCFFSKHNMDTFMLVFLGGLFWFITLPVFAVAFVFMIIYVGITWIKERFEK